MVQNMMLFGRFGKVFQAGSVVFAEGERGAEMYVIQTGKVKISKRAGQTERLLSTLEAGEVFGEMALVDHQLRSATATVIEEAKLLVIDSKTFEAMLLGSPEIALRIMRMLVKRLQEAHEQIECLLMSDLQMRVVRTLSFHAARAQHAGARPDHLITLLPEEMASQLGMTAGQVNAVLNELAAQQLVQTREDGILIKDVIKLKEHGS